MKGAKAGPPTIDAPTGDEQDIPPPEGNGTAGAEKSTQGPLEEVGPSATQERGQGQAE